MVIDFHTGTTGGDVPPLTLSADVRGSGKRAVTYTGPRTVMGQLATREGTTEAAECSNRGLCDRRRGRCDCFKGAMSSDGRGREGTRDDCGHVKTSVLDKIFNGTFPEG